MTYVTFRYAIVGFAALTIAVPSFWVAARPSRPTSRLGMRGKKRQEALLKSPMWASIEPFVRWTGARLNGVLPRESDTKLDMLLTHAGDYRGLVSDELAGLMAAAGALVAFVSMVIGLTTSAKAFLLGIPLAAVLGGAVPYFYVDAKRMARLRIINRGLPNVIDLLALSMSAGLDFPGALRQLVERSQLPAELRDELEYMLQQLQLGRTRANVLRELADRAPIDAVRELSQAITQAEERGNPVAAVLEIQATTSRTRRTNLAERAANDMKARMVLPTMLLVGVGLTLIAIPSAMMLEKFTGGVATRRQ